jgi:WXXGXW repeat (2 copies)
MKTMQRVLYAGFAAAALASVSPPALSSWTLYPGVDFEWYANVGKPVAGPVVVQAYPAPREGYIWSPGHYETSGARQVWVEGHWIADDYAQQVATYASRGTYATGPTVLRDRDGNVIPTDPAAYPLGYAR